MRNPSLQLALVFAAAGVCGAANASEATSPQYRQKSVVVRYTDDDLVSDNGATHLYSMLDKAARYVCDDTSVNLDLRERSEVSRCEQAAIANAVATVSSASLTNVYNRHYRYQPLVEKERLSEHTRALLVVRTG